MFYLTKTPFILQWLYPELIWKKKPENNELYLTFDDGPVPDATSTVLRILAERNIKATFFCVGDNVRKHPEVFQQLVKEGHSVGNHTFNHFNGWSCPMQKYVDNVHYCDQEFRKYGVETVLFRPPYGKIKWMQIKALKKKYDIVMWDVLSGDFDPNLNSEQCLKRTIKATTDGSVIVFHDNNKNVKKIKEVLPLYLDYFLAKGYKFLPL